MALATSFVRLIEEGLRDAATPSMNALALKWGVPAQYISRWRYEDQLPELWRVPDLAARIGMTAGALEHCWLESARLLSYARHADPPPPPLGERPRANLSLPPVRKGRRRRLAVWLFAATSAGLVGAPLRVVEARPITASAQLPVLGADSRDSVACGGRRAGGRRRGVPPTRWAA